MRRVRLSVLVGVLVVSLVSLSGVTTGAAAPGPEPAPASAAQSWLERINQVRTASGLPAATENPAWTDGIRKHLVYLENTPPALMTGAYASAHTENPASPYYTPEGALEASRSNLGGGATDVDAINGWLTAPFHAIGILRYGLTQVAFARSLTGTAGLDVIGGITGATAPGPVLFPGPGSTTDLSSFQGENPDPTETCTLATGTGPWSGLPLIAMLTAAPHPAISATLSRPDGSTVASSGTGLCLVDEHHYQSTDTVYGPTGLSILQGEHAVLLIPRSPLTQGTYTATISQPGQPDIVWSFVSAPAGGSAEVTSYLKRCSFTGDPSGLVRLLVRNPADGGGPASYSLQLPDRLVTTPVLADGASKSLLVDGVPSGNQSFVVTGTDGSVGSGSYDVEACPAYQGVVAKIRRPDRDRLRVKVVLRNVRNAAAVRFKVSVSGSEHRKVLVAGGSRKRVWIKLRASKPTEVRVKVAGHTIGSKGFRP